MPIKDTSEITRSLYDPGPDELDITLPHHDKLETHGSRNGSFSIKRLPDGGAEIGARENIHEWGNTQKIRFDADAWAVVQAFVGGGEGSSYITPFRDDSLREAIRAETAERKAKG